MYAPAGDAPNCGLGITGPRTVILGAPDAPIGIVAAARRRVAMLSSGSCACPLRASRPHATEVTRTRVSRLAHTSRWCGGPAVALPAERVGFRWEIT